MRRVVVLPRLIAVLCAFGVSVAPAAAQSFFQSVFGGGAPAASARGSERLVPSLRSFQRISPYGSGVQRSYPEAAPPASSYSGGGYRTLCVRTCDGYYWPINNESSRDRFHAEARRCEQSCDSEAKLYYLPRGSDDIAGMTDLTGRTYGGLANAFAYRRTLVAGCSCRPMPWNQMELARHAQYTLADQLERDRRMTAPPPAPPQLAAVSPAAPKAPAPAVETPQVAAATPEPVEASATEAKQEAGPAPMAVQPRMVAETPGEMFSDFQPAPPLPAAVVAPIPSPSPDAPSTANAAATAEAVTEAPLPSALPGLTTASVDPSSRPKDPSRRPRAQRMKSRNNRTALATGWLGQGGGKYTWPGDAPRRVR